MRTDSRRHRVTQRAMGPVRKETAPRALHSVVGREIGTGGTGIGDYNGVRVQCLGYFRYHSLRFDWLVVGQGEGVEFSEFLLRGFLHYGCFQWPAHHFERLVQRRHGELRVAQQRHVQWIVGAEHPRVYIYVDHLRFAGRWMTPPLGGHGAGTATDEDDQIRLIDDCTGFWRAAVGAHDTHRQRM